MNRRAFVLGSTALGVIAFGSGAFYVTRQRDAALAAATAPVIDDAVLIRAYTMSHSAALYLIGPKGDWLRQFDYGTPADAILSDLKSRF
ncbi:hypothetical protein [Phaeovulum sp. W22_SRMD_FR3]|jgi:cytochrome oxidase Cu insertion factor (SCO1/SenC/PrrC family)|uniref:hypothetical protein n=1 Tax=Phaeovulum sp. W22_SRMD_FR3 TaxID=3240274 RepID=UPI003F9557B6